MFLRTSFVTRFFVRSAGEPLREGLFRDELLLASLLEDLLQDVFIEVSFIMSVFVRSPCWAALCASFF